MNPNTPAIDGQKQSNPCACPYCILVLLALCITVAFYLVATLAGCSATQVVSDELQNAQKQSTGIVTDLQDAKNTGEVGPAALPLVDSAQGRARSINASASKALSAVPGLQDKESAWLPIAGRALWILSIIAGIAAAAYFGIGPLIRSAVAVFPALLDWIPALIPKPVKARADLDAHAITDHTATPTHREAIAASRAADPEYDAAFKLARKRQTAGHVRPFHLACLCIAIALVISACRTSTGSTNENRLRAGARASAADAGKLLDQDNEGRILLNDSARKRLEQIKRRAEQ